MFANIIQSIADFLFSDDEFITIENERARREAKAERLIRDAYTAMRIATPLLSSIAGSYLVNKYLGNKFKTNIVGLKLKSEQ
ncbi:ATP synthase subunit b [Acrasis kona]|uniref:ATP synthase subunit b n=1 Tax=Acrasis kona TaxID=1008807 RepID=A0AAW2ZHY6_9EUKA